MPITYLDARESLAYKLTPHYASLITFFHDDGFGGCVFNDQFNPQTYYGRWVPKPVTRADLEAAIAEQAAVIQRRMDDIKLQAERYVSLEDTCRELHQQLAERDAEIARLINAVADHVTVRAEQRAQIERLRAESERRLNLLNTLDADNELLRNLSFRDERDELRQQLAAQQAIEKRLRSLLPVFRPKYGAVGSRDVDVAKQIAAYDAALALPSDDTALREYGAKLVERIAKYFDVTNDIVAEQIRKGDFNDT